MLFRLTLVIGIACVTACAAAAPIDSHPADRYLDLNMCMDRTMGKGWQQRYDIHMRTNRWGAPEANSADLDSAPQAVRMTAMRCRREASLGTSTDRD